MLIQDYSLVISAVVLLLYIVSINSSGKNKIEIFPLVSGILIWIIFVVSLFFLVFRRDSISELHQKLFAIGPVFVFLGIAMKARSAMLENRKRIILIDEESLNRRYLKGLEGLDKNNTCCSKYLTDNLRSPRQPKRGKCNNLGWYLFVAHFYKWELSYDVQITDNSIILIATSRGQYSSNFQFSKKSYSVTLSRQVNINCIFLENKCQAQASGFNEIDNDGHFHAAISVKVKEGRSPQQIIIGCKIISSLKGRIFIEEVNVGAKGIASATIKSDNKSLQSNEYSEEHEFICQFCDSSKLAQKGTY